MKENEVGHIVIIGTGGTIAGQASSADNLTDYKAGSVSVETLMNHVPGLSAYGPFESIQFSNIDSSDMTPFQWQKLSELVQSQVDRDDVDGVVITHGTDTMEETAYFLHLTVHTNKPIVMTGSMRPSTALSADGPVNLLQAVQGARSSTLRGLGVVVVMNGYVDSARDVVKQHTTDCATFGNSMLGHLGVIQDGVGYVYYAPSRRHTERSEFCRMFTPSHIEALPTVDIAYLYAGVNPSVIEYYKEASVKGLILGGLGHGSLPTPFRKRLEDLKIPMVKASRTAMGIVSATTQDEALQLIPSDSLNLVKSRILLMLGLHKGYGIDELKRLFREY